MPDGQYQPSMGLNDGEKRIADLIKSQYSNRRLFSGASRISLKLSAIVHHANIETNARGDVRLDRTSAA